MPRSRSMEDASTPASASASTSSASGPTDGNDDERRHVRLGDRKLVAMAAHAAAAVDWHALVVRARQRADFSVSVQREGGRTRVTTSGELACSVAELRAVLRPRSSEQYAATARELFGREFVYGAIVHRASASKPSNAADEPADVAVKTATFARRHLLALSEQWCFVDALHALAIGNGGGGGEGFALSMTSLDPDDVFLGKTKATVRALTGISAAYAVLPVDMSTRARAAAAGDCKTRVLVTLSCEAEASRRGNARPSRLRLPTRERMYQQWLGASQRARIQRLKDMARSVQQLPEIVRRRRLGAQVFVDVAALRPANERCPCCTKLLATVLARHKKQCHLCGWFVCEQCSRQEAVERGRVKNFIVRVCEHCLERVDDAIYDNLPAGGASPAAVLDDAPGDAEAPAGQLGDLLRDALLQASEARKPAVKAIIRSIAEAEEEEASGATAAPQSEDEYVAALRRLRLRPSSYAVANPTSRSYGLQSRPGTSSREAVPSAPMPEFEAQRLAALAHARLSDLRASPELGLICELGQKEIGCAAGVVTIITGDSMQIVASSEPAFADLAVPREDSICSHTILSRQLPLLLPHPEADVRFTRQAVVRRHGLRFYFGFPLTAADGSPIGTFCCVGTASHTVSKAQYAAVERLAHCASRVLRRHLGSQRAAGPSDADSASAAREEMDA